MNLPPGFEVSGPPQPQPQIQAALPPPTASLTQPTQATTTRTTVDQAIGRHY